MPLPQSVQRDLDAANAMLESMNAPAPAQEPVPPAPAPEPAPSPEPAPQPVVAAPAPQPAPADESAEVWRSRYHAVRGNIEQMRNQHTQRLNELQERIEALTRAQRAPEPPPAPAPPELATPDDIQTFGADVVQLIVRLSSGVVAREIARAVTGLDARLEAIENDLKGTKTAVVRTAEETFFDRLTVAVPNWEAINESTAWLEWLGKRDPVFRATRQAALNAAQEAMDVEATAALFKQFVAETSPPVPAAPVAAPANPLAKMVVPSTAAPAPASTANPAPKMVHASEYAAFLNDVRRGAYRGREAEATRLEAEFNQALAEGRMYQ